MHWRALTNNILKDKKTFCVVLSSRPETKLISVKHKSSLMVISLPDNRTPAVMRRFTCSSQTSCSEPRELIRTSLRFCSLCSRWLLQCWGEDCVGLMVPAAAQITQSLFSSASMLGLQPEGGRSGATIYPHHVRLLGSSAAMPERLLSVCRESPRNTLFFWALAGSSAFKND